MGRARGTCSVAGIREVADIQEAREVADIQEAREVADIREAREVADLQKRRALGSPALQGSGRKMRVPQRTARTRCIARPRFDVGLPRLSIGGAARCSVTQGPQTAHGGPPGCAVGSKSMIESGTPLWSLKLNHTESIVNEQDIKIRFRRDHGAAA